MEQRRHQTGVIIRPLLPIMCMVLCMIVFLHACSAPKVIFPTEDEISALVLSYLRDGEFANVTKFAVFEVHDRVVGQRRGLLDYLKKTNLEGYRALIEKLGLRK